MRINALSLAIAAPVRIRNDNSTLEDLENRLTAVLESAKSIQARADGEKRPCTAEEDLEIRNYMEAFNDTVAEIERRKSLGAMEAHLRTSAQEAAEGNLPRMANQDPPARVTPPANNREDQLRAARQRSTVRIEAADDKGKHGFRSFGEFAMSVLKASAKGSGTPDPRLFVNQAPTTYGSEGVGADGGFAVPPDFRAEIMIKVMGEDTLMGRTDQQTSSSNAFTFPKDETTPWQSSGGIQAYWDGEAGQKTQSKPSLQQETVKLNKLIALVPVTDELLEDVPSMTNYLRKKTPEKINFKINDAIINGTGSGMPLGILNSGALITAAPTSGQAADTVTFDNIVDMWTRLYAPCQANAVWILNQDVQAQLMKMSFNGVSGSNVYPTPVYLPPGGLSGSPYATLMGRPVIPSQASPALGNVGDIIVGDLREYLSISKIGGIREDVSIHLFFDYDVTAFRFVLRVGGQPWWSAPIAPFQAGAQTRSCFVALGAR